MRDGASRPAWRPGVLSILATLIAACGSGSSGKPPLDHPPVLARPNPDQHAVFGHAFSYDTTQGGTTFTDPDGDPLTYEIALGHSYSPYNDPNPPAGLYVEGTRVMGVPNEVGAAVVTLTAKDKAGDTANNQFVIHVADNSAPVVVKANAGAIVPVGRHFDYDATQAGTVFRDPDGDALTYEISLRGQTDHVALSGTHVTGEIDTVGKVEVTITASDGYGGSASNVFVIATPGPSHRRRRGTPRKGSPP